MRVSVRVKAGSKKGPLVELSEEGTYIVFLKNQALDGKANQELIAVLANHFKCLKNRVSIASGMTSRNKIVEIKEK